MIFERWSNMLWFDNIVLVGWLEATRSLSYSTWGAKNRQSLCIRIVIPDERADTSSSQVLFNLFDHLGMRELNVEASFSVEFQEVPWLRVN